LSAAFLLAPKRAKVGDILHQPSPLDQPTLTASTRVAALCQIFAAKPGLSNSIDVATAELSDGIESSGNRLPRECPDADRIISKPIPPSEIKIGDAVAFVGRSSGFSQGTIEVLGIDNMRVKGESGELIFGNLIEVKGAEGPFSKPGDAGALVYRRSDFAAIGLVFASYSGLESTLLLPLFPALEAANARLDVN
jgi:hypothetical protein